MSSIVISGITSIDAYPKDISIKYCKQCMEKFEVCIPPNKPDMEEPNDIHLNICIDKMRIIETVLGPKLVIEGIIRIKLIYTAENRVQSIHSAHFEKVFCEYILLRNIRECGCSLRVNSIFAGIEDVCITYVGTRDLKLSILFILCPRVCEHQHRENRTSCCMNDLHVLQLETNNISMGSETKIIEYNHNQSEHEVKKEVDYKYQVNCESCGNKDIYSQNKCYRRRCNRTDYYEKDREDYCNEYKEDNYYAYRDR